MHATHQFDALYRDLVGAWEAHQMLRRSHGSIAELFESSLCLDQARLAMWDWHTCHSSVSI